MTVLPIALVAGVAMATTAWGILGLVLVVAALLGVAAFVYLRHRMNRALPVEDDLPPLLLEPPAGPRRSPQPTIVSRPAAAAAPPQVMVPGGGERRPPAAAAASAPAAAPAPRAVLPEEADLPAGEEVRVGQVHFHRPPEGTLQLLPGRLEILAGTDRVDEIRFLKLPGRDAAVTFGRSAGEPHAHVQLEAPTVSRMHARMSYRGGRWRIANLSRTNPILVNGEQLPLEEDAAAVLEDGDRVEMGQVVFRFRMR